MKTVTLITGGAGSGKTRYALELTAPYANKAYIATAEVTDDEMQLKIDKHRMERGHSFTTIEEPIELHQAVKTANDQYPIVIVDCITFWVNNLMYYEKDFSYYVDLFLDSIRNPAADIVIVTNEVGVGIIPGDPLTRDYARKVARINRKAAEMANTVTMMVAGLPLNVK